MAEIRPAVRRSLAIVVCIAAAVVLARWLLPGGGGSHPQADDGAPDFGSVVDFLASPPEAGFDPVVRGRRFSFPEDHGAHPGYRQEWWYFTGRLEASSGREFGYQLTFFRFAAGESADGPDSAWAADQSWMAHLAVTDVKGGRFHRDEDFARGTLGLAGARGEPFSVWVNGWSVHADETGGDCPGCFVAALAAKSDDVALSLRLQAADPPILQGEEGYSIKTSDGRAASYYYSMPGIATAGNLVLGDESFEVSGESWMDREWSSAVLTPGQSGWDWFSLNLDNGHRLTLFQVREAGAKPHIFASWIGPDGAGRVLAPEGVTLRPIRYWSSDETGATYPVEWLLQGNQPEGGWRLSIFPVIDGQEMALAFRYYEGLVNIDGVWGGEPVGGWGYLELTGYGVADGR